MNYDVLIIGGGPAGYSAALYAARGGLDTVVIEKLSAGGQMNLTGSIDNYPGFEEGIDGFTLAMKMQKNISAEKLTKIGKYILNHSFMMPGMVATVVAIVVGILLIQVF